MNMTLPGRAARGGGGAGARGRARRLRLLQGQGRAARRRRARGRGARRRGTLARAARGRQPRLVGGRRRCSAIRAIEDARPRVRGAALPHARGAAPRCAGACPRRSRPTSRSARRATLRRAIELEACDVVNVKLAGARRLQARARDAAAGARARRWAPSCRAPSTAPGASPPRFSSRPPEDAHAGLRAGHARPVRRPAGRARCRGPRQGTLRVPARPRAGRASSRPGSLGEALLGEVGD